MATKLNLPITIPQRAFILEFVKQRVTAHAEALTALKLQCEIRDKAYLRTSNLTKEHVAAVRANALGDAKKLQDLTVPVVMPQVESATAYQAAVFLTSHPIMGVISSPAQQDVATKFEAVIESHARQFTWVRPLIKAIRDGFKYNLGFVTLDWAKVSATGIKSRVANDTTAGMAQLDPLSYEGNAIKYISVYKALWDTMVAPCDLHAMGEFFGYSEILSRIQLKMLVSTLDPSYTTSLKEAYESRPTGSPGYAGNDFVGIPSLNIYGGLVNATTQSGWSTWVAAMPASRSGSINYSDSYEVTKMFVRALPSDFGRSGNTVKVYKLYIVNWSYVIYAEEMTTAHGLLPVFGVQPNEDGLEYQSASMADNSTPFQDMSSALWGASIAARRRAVFDRLLYNPRLVDKKDIDPTAEVSRIPLKNASMLKDPITQAIYQIPFRDDNSGTNLQMASAIAAMANESAGQNRVDQGQFQPGNKTKTEFQTVMHGSNARQQLTALTLEHSFFTPLKYAVKYNMLQYQPAGKILDTTNKAEVEVDPSELRKLVAEFKITDGLVPAEKMVNADLMTVLFQMASAMPELGAEYDMMGMFLYWMKLRGASWLEEFKRNEESKNQYMQNVARLAAAQKPAQGPQQ